MGFVRLFFYSELQATCHDFSVCRLEDLEPISHEPYIMLIVDYWYQGRILRMVARSSLKQSQLETEHGMQLYTFHPFLFCVFWCHMCSVFVYLIFVCMSLDVLMHVLGWWWLVKHLSNLLTCNMRDESLFLQVWCCCLSVPQVLRNRGPGNDHITFC